MFVDMPGEFRNSRNKLGVGIDTRCDGGYVLVPPSVITAGPYVAVEPLWSAS